MEKGGTLGKQDPEAQREEDFSKERMLRLIIMIERWTEMSTAIFFIGFDRTEGIVDISASIFSEVVESEVRLELDKEWMGWK